MRVLMLSQFIAPVTGGQERMVEMLASGLARNGHDVVVATAATADPSPPAHRDDIRVRYVRSTLQRATPLYQDTARRHLAPAPDPELTLGLRRLLAAERPDVVHAHDWMVHSLLPLWRRCPPVCMTLHDYGLTCTNKRMMHLGVRCSGPSLGKCIACASEYYGPLRGAPMAVALRGLRPSVLRLVDRFLPVSRAVSVAQHLPEMGACYDVVPNFVSGEQLVSRAESTEPPPGLPAGEFVMFAGDATNDKGIDVLRAAATIGRGRYPIVVVGRTIDELAGPLPPNVHILGPQAHDLVLAAWRRAALAVVPSRWNEPFGLVALEAMALGKAVVASDVGGLPDIVVHERTGLLVPPGDAGALASAIDRLMGDRELRERYGRAGAARVMLHFDEQVALDRHQQIYEEMVVRATSA